MNGLANGPFLNRSRLNASFYEVGRMCFVRFLFIHLSDVTYAKALENNAIPIVVYEPWMTAVFGGATKFPFIVLQVRMVRPSVLISLLLFFFVRPGRNWDLASRHLLPNLLRLAKHDRW